MVLAPFTFMMLFSLLNCSRFEKLKSSDSASTQPPTSGEGNNSGFDSSNGPTTIDEGGVKKVSLPLFLMSADQMRTSMLTATNRPPDVRIFREFGGRYSMLADGTDLNLANAPFQLSATSLAGAICQEAYDEERLLPADQRTVFKTLDFNINPANLTDQQFNATIRFLARLFWARNETAEELKHFQEFRKEFMSDPTVPTTSTKSLWQDLATGICAATLSSFDALTY